MDRACVVVASTRTASGARAIGYACTTAATDQLTTADAGASTDSMTGLAGAAYLTELRRRRSLRSGP
jgi:MYXO-CTERM domain-containing protein